MGILSNIFSKIFPGSRQGQAGQGGQATAQSQQRAPMPGATNGPPQGSSGTGGPQPAQQPMQQVDVEAILNDKASRAGQPLNWRTSIVDLLKLLDIDNSLQARKELARELNYTGDMNDSAAMNIWLHRQVMNKLAANGGRVPADLRD